MLPRVISLVLIAAVIACPMWCGESACIADQCRTHAAPQQSAPCSANQKPDCCSGKQGGHQRHQDEPCPCESAGCQGICGGAVPEKPFELKDLSIEHVIVLDDVHAATKSDMLVRSHCAKEPEPGGSPANYGRIVRTLHMSILC